MSKVEFTYQAAFPLGEDKTEYYLLTSDHVSVGEFEGETILKVAPEALTLLATTSLPRRLLHAPP